MRIKYEDKFISSEYTTKLVEEYKETKDPILMDEIIQHNYKLVMSTCDKYIKMMDECHKDDIIQEAMFGLTLAIKRFDPSLGNQFSTYATQYIGAYARNYYLKYSNSYTIGRTTKEKIIEYYYYIDEHPDSSDKKIMKDLKISKKLLKFIKGINYKNFNNELRLDYNEDGDRPIELNGENPISKLEMQMYIDYILSWMDDMDKDIIMVYFINDLGNLSYELLAKKYNKKPNYIHKRKDYLITKLRKKDKEGEL